MYPCFTFLQGMYLKVDQRVQKNYSLRIHLNVSWESYLLEHFDLSFDLKLVLWQVLNYLYSKTYMIYLWVSILHQLVHLLYISCNMCTRDLPDMYMLNIKTIIIYFIIMCSAKMVHTLAVSSVVREYYACTF